MTIRYQCEECGAALNIDDELAGTEGSCPRCHVEFVVPAPGDAPKKSEPAKKTKSSGSLTTEDEIGDFLNSEEPSVPTGRSSLATNEDTEFADDNPFEDPPNLKRKQVETEIDEESVPNGKKGAKGAGKPAADASKKDSTASASLAKSLMGKGGAAETDDAEPATKKRRRQFGEGNQRSRGEITSVGSLVRSFLELGWPALVGVIVVSLFGYFIYVRMQPALNHPPLGKAEGIVTIDDKPVAPGTIVTFTPLMASTNFKLGSSSGITGEGGKFSLLYGKDMPGAVIGFHWVTIVGSDPTQGIPGRYNSVQGELQKEVTKEGTPIEIHLKSDPKPTE